MVEKTGRLGYVGAALVIKDGKRGIYYIMNVCFARIVIYGLRGGDNVIQPKTRFATGVWRGGDFRRRFRKLGAQRPQAKAHLDAVRTKHVTTPGHPPL